MSETTTHAPSDIDRDFQWFGDPKTILNKEFPIPQHPGEYDRRDVKSYLDGAGLKVHTQSRDPEDDRHLESFKGQPYTGPIFRQGVDGTCLPWAITHATLAVGANPDLDITTDLLNASRPNATKEEGLVFAEALPIVQRPASSVAIGLIDPLHVLEQGEGGNIFQVGSTTERFKQIVRHSVRNKRALVLALQENPEDPYGHSVCVPSYRIHEGQMELQVIDSERGQRFTPVDVIAKQVYACKESIMTVYRKPAQVPQPR